LWYEETETDIVQDMILNISASFSCESISKRQDFNSSGVLVWALKAQKNKFLRRIIMATIKDRKQGRSDGYAFQAQSAYASAH